MTFTGLTYSSNVCFIYNIEKYISLQCKSMFFNKNKYLELAYFNACFVLFKIILSHLEAPLEILLYLPVWKLIL